MIYLYSFLRECGVRKKGEGKRESVQDLGGGREGGGEENWRKRKPAKRDGETHRE